MDLDVALSNWQYPASSNPTTPGTAEATNAFVSDYATFASNTTSNPQPSSRRSPSNDSKKNDSAAVVTELTKLSMQLSPLFRTICELSYHQNQIYQEPLIDDATTASIATWLAHSSSTANQSVSPDDGSLTLPLLSTGVESSEPMLCRIFSASHSLQQILRGSQSFATASAPTATATTETSVSQNPMLFTQPSSMPYQLELPYSPYFELPPIEPT